MITVIILLLAAAIIVMRLSRHRERFLLLEEVIPRANIVDREEGIIDHNGTRFIVGVSNLEFRRHLIDSLELLGFGESFTVNLKFNKQIIISKESGPKNVPEKNDASLRRN